MPGPMIGRCVAGFLRAIDPAPPLRDRVYLEIEALIIEGRISPGQRLVENSLAEQLQVSRGPVREAIQLLERDGWVTLLPRRGAYVRVPSSGELEEFFATRMILEVEAARLAAERVANDADEPEVAAFSQELQRAVDYSLRLSEELPDQVNRVALGPDGLVRRRAYRDVSNDVHRGLALLSRNAGLADVISYTARRTRCCSASSDTSQRSLRIDEHCAIINAVLEGDAARAQEEMKQHLLKLTAVTLEVHARVHEPQLAAADGLDASEDDPEY
jgi:DNA-binding GntR family transcriptional regulator